MGFSGDPLVYVVKAVTRRVCRLRSHTAPLSTPLSRVYTGVGRHTLHVTPALITKTLKNTVQTLGSSIGFMPNDASARSLRVAGAMALLAGKVDSGIIQILGRWRSDEMFCYLHLSVEPIMKGFAAKMLNADYTMATLQLVPCH